MNTNDNIEEQVEALKMNRKSVGTLKMLRHPTGPELGFFSFFDIVQVDERDLPAVDEIAVPAVSELPISESQG